MRLLMSRAVVRVATRKSRVFILRIDLNLGNCSEREQYAASPFAVKMFFALRDHSPQQKR
jgi:hypothetical protein